MMLMIKFSLRVHLCNQSVSISVLFSQYEATARRVEPLGMCVCAAAALAGFLGDAMNACMQVPVLW